MSDQECNTEVEHYHCVLPDCEEVVLTRPDLLKHSTEDHEVEEWIKNYSWATKVMGLTMDVLEAEHPNAYEHVQYEIENLRHLLEYMYGSGMN